MNKDIRLATSFKGHRKRKKLKRLLGFGAEVYLIDLWLTVSMDCPEGVLVGWDDEDIADSCGWEGEPHDLVMALIDSGWLEKNSDGEFALHDWCEHQGWACKAKVRSEAAKKAANKRWEKKNGCGSDAGASDPQCGSDAGALRNDAKGNAPSPLPNPLPSPLPNPLPSPLPNPLPSPLPNQNIKDILPKGNMSTEEPVNKKTPICPHKKIISLYNETLGGVLPQCKSTNKTLESNLRSRWREDKTRQDLEWWRQFFNSISESDFLMGRTGDWNADLTWLVKPTNMSKVINGNYKNKISKYDNGRTKTDRSEKNKQACGSFIERMMQRSDYEE